jgi:alkylhydroperoxidase family enzyme
VAALESALAAGYAAVEPALLELVHAQVAQMIHGTARMRPRHVAQDKLDALDSWPSSPLFSEAERACLALAEQTVVSVAGIDDRMIEDVLRHLDPGELYGLVNALYVIDAMERLDVAAGRLFDDPRERP